MSPSAPRIAIIGGGPGGLTLLNVLARRGIAATVYERDESATSRTELGSMLDLHEESGQAAMHGAGLFAGFEAHARAAGAEFLVTDRTGEPILHFKPGPDGPAARPEIDRHDLRQVLIDGSPAERIKWGHTFVSARPVDGTHEWEVAFANGATVTADLVVGADGGRSRVRPLVSPAQTVYTGLQVAETHFLAREQPELAARCGSGTVYAVDDHKMYGAQVNGDGRVRVYSFFRAPEDFKLPDDPEAGIAAVLAQVPDWAPWLRQLFAVGDRAALTLRGLYELPAPHTWPHRRGVTLVGDAMNLMTNFAGKGANTAMWDALELGLNIAKACETGWEDALDGAVAEYEQRMCIVAGNAAQESHDNMVSITGDNGAQGFLEVVRAGGFAEGAEPTKGAESASV